VIARSEHRGLGYQSRAVVEHMDPVSVLHVDMGVLARGFDPHPGWYPDAATVGFDGHRFDDVDVVQDFVRSVDIIYTAETPYDWRLCGWCRTAGAGLVVHTNPELHRLVVDRDGEEPSVWWNPTGWHMDLLRQPDWTQAPVVEVPMPVDTDRFRPVKQPSGRPTFLHVQGHPAAGDRNGTSTIARALRRVAAQQRWIIRSQNPAGVQLPAGVTGDVTIAGPVDDPAGLYVDADVLVMPRRYGGLSLPVHEAMACGLAVVMPDCPPNRRWPIIPMLAEHPGVINRRGIVAWSPNFVDLAAVCDRLDGSPDLVAGAQAWSLAWAAKNSWQALKPVWQAALETAAGASPSTLPKRPTAVSRRAAT